MIGPLKLPPGNEVALSNPSIEEKGGTELSALVKQIEDRLQRGGLYIHNAEDLAQDAGLSWIEKKTATDRIAEMLGAVTRNLKADFYRQQKRSLEVELPDDDLISSGFDESDASSPEVLLLNQEDEEQTAIECRVLEDAIKELPLKWQLIVGLAKFGDPDHVIARELELQTGVAISPKTVGYHRRKAFKILKDVIEQWRLQHNRSVDG